MGKIGALALALAVTLAGFASGCAKDRTLDDYRHERVGEEVSKIQAVSGVYRGTLLSKKDGSTLGALAIEIEPTLSVGSSSDQLVSEQHAAVKGTVTYVGARKAYMAFSQASYDSDAAKFKATTSVNGRGGQALRIDLEGVMSAGALSGTIETFGFGESGGTFTLTKDGPMPDGQKQISPGAPGAGAESDVLETYASSVRFSGDGAPTSVQLLMLSQKSSAEQDFADLITPVKSLDVTLVVGTARLAFPNAQWDQRTGSLRGEAQGDGGGEHYVMALECGEARSSGARAWDCQYLSNRRGLVFRAVFTRSKQAQEVGVR